MGQKKSRNRYDEEYNKTGETYRLENVRSTYI